jgi:GNAT superfamily N-acetyltransferase
MAGIFAIRPADRSDAEALAAFTAGVFRATYRNDTPAADLDAYIGKSFGTEQQQAEIADPSGAVFLAMAEERVIGCACVLIGQTDAETAFLNRFYVDVDWRGRGVAKDLLEVAMTEARRRGATRLELTVFEKNARAIAFYRKSGFAVTGSTIFPVGEEMQTDIVMTRMLDGAMDGE